MFTYHLDEIYLFVSAIENCISLPLICDIKEFCLSYNSRIIIANITTIKLMHMLTNRSVSRTVQCYIYDLKYFCSLAESNLPYKLLARSGVHDMLAVGGDKVIYF